MKSKNALVLLALANLLLMSSIAAWVYLNRPPGEATIPIAHPEKDPRDRNDANGASQPDRAVLSHSNAPGTPEARREKGHKRSTPSILPTGPVDISQAEHVETAEKERVMEEAHNPAAPTERGGTERMDKVQIGASSEAGTFEVTPLGTERGQSVTVFSAARVAPVQVLPMPSPTVLQQPAEAIDNSLTPRQAAEISRLQQDFSDRVGGPGQDPNDADYRARWLLASRLSEQDAEIILGSVFMDRYRAALAARQ